MKPSKFFIWLLLFLLFVGCKKNNTRTNISNSPNVPESSTKDPIIDQPSTNPPPAITTTKSPNEEATVIEFTKVPLDHRPYRSSITLGFSAQDSNGIASVKCSVSSGENPLNCKVDFVNAPQDLGGISASSCTSNGKTIENCRINYSYTVPTLNLGLHTFTVEVIDILGNKTSKEYSWNICDPFDDSNTNDCIADNGLVGTVYRVGEYVPNMKHKTPFKNYLTGPREGGVIAVNHINHFTGSSKEEMRIGSTSFRGQFLLYLKGFIQLNMGNTTESYEFAILSDDGMKVTLDEEIILDDPPPHSPRWMCTSASYEFAPHTAKPIEVLYVQVLGGTTMRLMYRKVGEGQGCPVRFSPPGNGWKDIPSEFFLRPKTQ